MPSSHAKRGRIAAWLVHFYTASGAVIALVGANAVVQLNARVAFSAMFLATLVDATDGLLARAVHVKERLPDIDGARIDDLVDYITFVFLPMFFAVQFGMLPPDWSLPIAAAVLLASMYGFVAPDAKTADFFFTGFPSYWNIAVLYLFVLEGSPTTNAIVLLGLVVMVFVRIGYVYPSRTPVLRRTTVSFGALWGLLLTVVIWRLPERATALAILSLAFPVYYFVLSLYLQSRRRA